ncbi:MAG: metalloendopeptidase [Gammaproteobacteria bacterium HGW-Gammaproteobacteria-15]|nr:MAG: metalloendopeptidase [Gammaproteobacteria bacterium HGW-Gammaproteobacteria-15]
MVYSACYGGKCDDERLKEVFIRCTNHSYLYYATARPVRLLARAFSLWLILLATVLTGCSSRSTPAPVSTLELRENFYQQRNRGSLSASSYTVQRGDTLYSIAFRAGKDVRELARLNAIASPYTIYPGQQLKLTGVPPRQVAKPAAKPVATKPATTTAQNTNKNDSSQAKSNSSVKPAKPVAPKNQTGYVQTNTAPEKKAQNPTLSGNVVQWQWPVKGKIISGFSHQQQGNKGVDIAGREGDRINAAASGQVVYAGNALRGYGNLIIIKHNDDYLSAYAHNRRLLVTERQMVTAGQQIAEMGSTDATDPRLHFEIRFRGTSVDPLKYLPK